jgi:hypothetical protein
VRPALRRRRIKNVFGVPPAAVPREAPLRRPGPPRAQPPGFDIDEAIRSKLRPRRKP